MNEVLLPYIRNLITTALLSVSR